MKYEFIYLERPECTNYNILDEPSRTLDHGDGTDEGSKVQGINKHYCDNNKYPNTEYPSPKWVGPAWYRFTACRYPYTRELTREVPLWCTSNWLALWGTPNISRSFC